MDHYKEKLKLAQELYDKVKYLSSTEALATCQFLEKVFPELRETEDEMIRKELLDYLKRFIPHIDYDLVKKSKVWIDWLEKQGEQKSKQYWSQEDELMIQAAIHWIQEFQKSDRCRDENDMQNSVTCQNWLKSIIGIEDLDLI